MVDSNIKELSQANKPAIIMAISDMYFLGKELIDKKVIQHIKLHLGEEQFLNLQQMNLSPWMNSALNLNIS